ncbi:MAG TPA: DUF1707 domain-containing protein [Trebonia sp.]|jgi:hypothetical protein
MPPRFAPRDLRAADSDRERVIAMLGDALADGRLSHDEYSERMPLALSARTLGDLAGLTADLAAPEHQPVQVDGGRPVTALFSGAHRRGRWVVPASLTCVSAFGDVVLDLSEAILQERHVVLNVYAVFGRLRLIVPAGVEVVMNGSNILSRQRGATAKRVPTSLDIPVIEVRGYFAASEVVARTPPRPKRWRNFLPGARPPVPPDAGPRRP